MKIKVVLIIAFLVSLLCSTKTTAHPGSGIVVDKKGQVYITDTGKGVWRIDTKGQLNYVPAPGFHWMDIDEMGYFKESPKSFGNYFERISPQNAKPTLLMCSDFPIAVNKDGNIYYAQTLPGSAKIIRRTPGGKESVLAGDKIFEFIGGIATDKEGSLYITESSNPRANTIRKITMKGKVSVIATFVGKDEKNVPLETVPSYCRGLAVDSTGTIYVAATGSRSVLKITPQGKITTILQESSPWAPTSVAVFLDMVYVLEWHDVAPSLMEDRSAWIPRVRKIDKNGKTTTLATVSR